MRKTNSHPRLYSCILYGIAASIVGLLIPSLFNAEERAESLTEQLQELVKASTLTEAQSKFLVSQTNDEIRANKQLAIESKERIEKLKETIAQQESLRQEISRGIDISKIQGSYSRIQLKDVGSLNKQLLEESANYDTLNNKIEGLIEKRDSYSAATRKSLEEQKEEVEVIQKANRALESFSSAIDMQVATMGMSERQVAQYKAAMLGASEATKDQIDLLFDHKEALEAQKNAQKESMKAIQTVTGASPALSIGFNQQEALSALQATYDSGLISEQEYLSQKLTLNEQYEDQVKQLQEERFRRENEGMSFLLDSMGALQSTSTSVLTGMLQGTTTLQQAFSSLANTVLNQAVGALVDLGFQYLKNQAIEQTASAASIATGVATGTSLAAAYATPATLASIATFGGAAATGQAAVTAAVASSKALAFGGGRESGGPVSAGSYYRMGEGNKPEVLQTSSGMYGIPGDNGRVFNSQQLDQIGGGSGGFNLTIEQMPGVVITTVSQEDKNMILRAAVSESVARTRSEYTESMKNRSGDYFNATAQNYGQGKVNGRNY